MISYIKMGKEILTFDDIEIEKNKLYCYKSPIFKNMQILRKYQYLTRLIWVKKTIGIIIIKLIHYI